MRKVTFTLAAVVLVCLGVDVGVAQGATWVQQATPNPYLIANYIYGVSCATPNACEAVGEGFEGGWNGTAWTIQPDVTAGTGRLNAVACAAANACSAVGSANGTATAARWDGTSWTLQPLPAGSGTLAISCPTATFCMAVGGGAAESWDGTAWTLRPVPAGSGTAAVSCRTATSCVAVGGGAAESWDGTSWALLPSIPLPAGAASAGLNGVSCTPRSCTAVGAATYPDGSVTPYAARWTGTRWHLMSTQVPRVNDGHFSSFASVSCHTARFCMAVGTRSGAVGTPPGLAMAFAELWTGDRWRLTPSPFGDQGAVPPAGSVSCPTRTRCEAVATAFSPVSTASFTLGAEYLR